MEWGGFAPMQGHRPCTPFFVLHFTVDDAPWHFVDTSGERIILVGLEPGLHKMLIKLADPTRNVITSEIVMFTVPDLKR